MNQNLRSFLFIVTAIGIAITQLASGQNTFQRTYNFSSTSFLREIIPVANNNYLVCGTLVGGGFYIMKADSAGQPIWGKAINNPKENYSNTFQPCTDGGIIMSGYIKDPYNNWDIFLTRTDSVGNVMWSHAYGGNGTDFGYFAKQTSDGGFITGGVMQDGGQQARNCLIKTDANGTVQWTQSYTDTATLSLSSGYDVIELSNGYILCGTMRNLSNPTFDNDGSLIRTDLNGNILWAHSFGFTEWDQFNKVISTSDGGFLAGGWVDTIIGGSNREVLLCKFDSSGNFSWGKTYGSTGDDLGWDFSPTSANGVVITGRTTSFNFGSPDYYMIVTDSLGNMIWSKSYGGGSEENLSTGLQTPDGGFMAGGSTVSFGSFSDNSYLVKTNANGYSSCNELLSPPTQTGNVILPLVNSLFLQIAGLDTNYVIISTTTNSLPTANLLCSSTSVAEVSTADVFSVTPNPAADHITVHFSKNPEEEMMITIYNCLGEIICKKSKNAGNRELTINTNQWTSGVYLLTASGKNGAGKTVKVIHY